MESKYCVTKSYNHGLPKHLSFIKFVLSVFSLFTLISFSAQAQSFSICGPSTPHKEFCSRMKHLRATVNALDSQTELMQANYKFLETLGLSIENNTSHLIEIIPLEMNSHVEGLKRINQQAKDFKLLAKQSDAESLVVANLVKGQCLNCHTSANPTGGIPWNDVFGFSWDKISTECSRLGRNPYLCKSMNAMMTDYNFILTGYAAQVEDFAVTQAMAKEVVRILQDLKLKNFVHLGEANRAEAEGKAQEVADLAAAKDPSVFEKARLLNTTCTKCHSEIAGTRIIPPIGPFSTAWASR